MTGSLVSVCFRIDARLIDRFRGAVFTYHRRLHGSIQQELTKAVEARLAELENHSEVEDVLEDGPD